MSQNRSHAVMAQRVEAHDSLDDFPTMPWATRALGVFLSGLEGGFNPAMSCWEPACNRGFMSRPLAEIFATVYSSDVHPYGFGAVRDFLWDGDEPTFDWIITNPPFRLAEQFALKAMQRARYGVAMIVRTAFLESVGRYERLFLRKRPTHILQFTERVPMVKGRMDPTASTATAYCWLVWKLQPPFSPVSIFSWVPPCRARLERPGDYEPLAERGAA